MFGGPISFRPETPCAAAASANDATAPSADHPMNLADVFTVVFVILGFLIVFVGYWLMAAGLFPRRIERCAEAIGAAPLKCTLVGFGCLAPLIALGVGVGKVAQSAPGKLASFLILVSSILLALFGTAGLALRIGQGLPAERDQREPWRRVLRGGVVLALTYGTVVLIPLILLVGFGAFVLASSRRIAPVPVPVPPGA